MNGVTDRGLRGLFSTSKKKKNIIYRDFCTPKNKTDQKQIPQTDELNPLTPATSTLHNQQNTTMIEPQYEDQTRYTAPPDPIGSEPDDHDPADDRHDPDGLDSDCWTIAQTIDIAPHPSDL